MAKDKAYFGNTLAEEPYKVEGSPETDQSVPPSGEAAEARAREVDAAIEPAPTAEPGESVRAEKPEKQLLENAFKTRNDIIKEMRAKRDAEVEEVVPEPVVEAEPVEATTTQKVAPAVAEKAEKPQETSPQKVKLKVDHKEIEVPLDEAIAWAQQHKAAENRLTEANLLAKRLKDEYAQALALRQQLMNTGQQPGPQAYQPQALSTAEQRTTPKGPTVPDLSQVVEKIRYGEDGEGEAALRSVVEAITAQVQQTQPQLSPQEVAALAAQMVQTQSITQQAVTGFAEKHPEIAQDEIMTAAQVRTMHAIVFDELKNLRNSEGLGVPPEYLQAASRDPNQAFAFHGDLRKQGWKLSTSDEVSERAAQWVETKYRLKPEPAPVPQSVEAPQPVPQQRPVATERREQRMDEKRAMPAQPRRASPTAKPVVQGPATRTSTVEKMRAARGHTNLIGNLY